MNYEDFLTLFFIFAATIVIVVVSLESSSNNGRVEESDDNEPHEFESPIVTGESDTIERFESIKPEGIVKDMFIDEIIYINLDRSTTRRHEIEEEIEKIKYLQDLPVTRFSAVARNDGALGCFLSHMCILLRSAQTFKNILILEDDFVFEVDSDELETDLKYVQTTFGNDGWDVIVFGQFVKGWSYIVEGDTKHPHMMRLLHSTTTSGYIVNKAYAMKFYNALSEKLTDIVESGRKLAHFDNIDQFQRSLQEQDLWLGFKKSIGGQRGGYSFIEKKQSNFTWTLSDDEKSWISMKGKETLLKIGNEYHV